MVFFLLVAPAVLMLVFLLYTQPEFLLTVATQLWLCF
jgi:hypothetical protein